MATILPQQPDGGAGPEERYAFSDSAAQTEYHAGRVATTEGSFFLSHLRSGMTLLDCGCGSGSITVGLAEAVSPGDVVGIDISEGEISRANALASERGAANVRFEVAGVHELPFPDSYFDSVFSHNVLEHVEDPRRAVEEMKRVLKPGGVLGVRDVDIGGVIVWPRDPLLEKSIAIWEEDWRQASGDPSIGRRLRELLNETGFTSVRATASYEYYETQELLQWRCEIVARRFQEPEFVDRIIKTGLADSPTIEKFVAAWRRLGANSSAFFAISHCEAVGWKD